MAISNEQFLFCCIENSNNGTVNWTAVADACGTTKGAASIKYRRMKDKFGTINEGDRDAGTGDADGEADKTTKKKAAPKKTSNKKRKVYEEEAQADDAEETEVKDQEIK